MVSTSQQESLRAQGITRLGWDRLPLAGHSVSFFTRSWEIGRMTAYVKNYSTAEEKIGHWYFCRVAFRELKEYVESRSELQDNFYKHLVINTQTRTFEDLNYANSIGSKVVIRPLAETLELSIKKNQQLQRTMVHTDPTSASQDAVATGDSPPGEIPEADEERGAGDSPSGEMPMAEEAAEVPEY